MNANQRMWVERMCLWLVWSSLIMRALVLVGAVEVEKGNGGSASVMAYWERKLHGAMPSSIRSMVTPLSSQQATQLLLKSKYLLPNNATIFCKTARIKCANNIMPAKGESDIEKPISVSYQSEGGAQSDSDIEIPISVSYQSEGGAQSDIEIPISVSYQLKGAQSDSDIEIPISVSYQSEGGAQSDSDVEIPISVSYQSEGGAQSDSDIEIPISVSYQSEGGAQSDSDIEIPISVSYQLEGGAQSGTQTQIPFGYWYSDGQSGSQGQVRKLQIPFGSWLLEAKSHARFQFSQHHPLKKESSQASFRALHRISPELTQGPRLLLSPLVQDVGLFFPEEALVTGRKLYVSAATRSDMHDDRRAFLPRRLAKLFPIDRRDEGSKIASMLAMSERSMKKSIHVCESRTTKLADVKACLTSIEDLADFVSGMLHAGAPTSKAPVVVKVHDAISNANSYKFVGRSYTVLIVKALKESSDEPSVACHDMPGFPFRVFYCHCVTQSQSFAVTLQAAEDGSVHERIANCHYNTSHWNPRSPVFKQLGFKPGEGAACHWLGASWTGLDGWLFLRE